MFNVKRTKINFDVKKYYSTKIVDELEKIFYGKCYLCEDKAGNINIEHLVPHKGNPELKYDWNNLYYSCSRCNEIKHEQTNILDCCNENIDVFKAIKCLCTTDKNGYIFVEAQNKDNETINTANLLNRCYNEKDTSTRRISQTYLYNKINDERSKFVDQCNILLDNSYSDTEKLEAKQELIEMTEISYPFSVFWKWHILSDNELLKIYNGK